ncbi:sensor histidine kinase [Pengzhenrongella sicca]|uniref:histidine kinase n=1 Tax=Pengzhenrongella sicca TaxID=2819238 RepID=A0A8A4ZG82_9MICO|nr:HAMP domain-containing sensor histidine kinase [Pengzhenrongella sicca]QTE31032.1 HAMP domain-containing histidine kinase [Pengzhenrongella sicca]
MVPGRYVRHSLIVRLLIVSSLIAVCSIGATAWLAAMTVSRGIQQAQGSSLANDSATYRRLLDYAATNRTWQDVGPVVSSLSTEAGRRVTLTMQDGTVIADSAALADPASTPDPLPARASAVVDPLAVDPALGAGASSDPIDARVVGPFALTSPERRDLEGFAAKILACVDALGGDGAISIAPSGRPTVETNSVAIAATCGVSLLDEVVPPTEAAALAQLESAVNACLSAQRTTTITLHRDLTWSTDAPLPLADQLAIPTCLKSSRQQLLAPYAPPAALLYLSSSTRAAPAHLDLSRANQLKIAALAAVVLLVAVGATAAAAHRMIRPLRALTLAAQRMTRGDSDARVQTRGRDEIAELGAAFNEMSAGREHMEEQRKALISDIAHELRSPLTNIRGWLEATEDGLAERTPELDRALLEEAIQLQRIVDDLQDLAMSDAGELRMHPQAMEVAPVLAQIRTAYSAQAAARGISLTTSTPDGLTLEADPVRIRQAIENLVTNALRHTPDGGTVTVTAQGEPGCVVVDVVDTGSGIEAADLPHLFDRFWRADRSRSRGSGGSGLGLAIANNLVHAHGGTLTAVSTVGLGSTFTLRLPAG